MNNKEKYVNTFSHLHSEHALLLEAEEMRKNEGFKGIRVKKSLAAAICVLVFMIALSCVTYAATDGEIVNTVKESIKVLINGNSADVNCDENGNVVIPLENGDSVYYEDGNGQQVAVDSDACKGKVTVDSETGDIEVAINEATTK